MSSIYGAIQKVMVELLLGSFFEEFYLEKPRTGGGGSYECGSTAFFLFRRATIASCVANSERRAFILFIKEKAGSGRH